VLQFKPQPENARGEYCPSVCSHDMQVIFHMRAVNAIPPTRINAITHGRTQSTYLQQIEGISDYSDDLINHVSPSCIAPLQHHQVRTDTFVAYAHQILRIHCKLRPWTREQSNGVEYRFWTLQGPFLPEQNDVLFLIILDNIQLLRSMMTCRTYNMATLFGKSAIHHWS
jgi:hypothetical protein